MNNEGMLSKMTPYNTHEEIWQNMNTPASRPECELSYLRAEYDGTRWSSSVNPVHRELFFHELNTECNALYEELRKAFPDDTAVRDYCLKHGDQCLKAPVETKISGKSFSFYIDLKWGYYWILMREGGTSNEEPCAIYVHCYRKMF